MKQLDYSPPVLGDKPLAGEDIAKLAGAVDSKVTGFLPTLPPLVEKFNVIKNRLDNIENRLKTLGG